MPNFSLVFLLLQRPSGLAVATGLAALAFFPIPSSAQAPPERPQADERADAQPARVPRHGLWVEAAFASGVPDRRDGPIVAWFGPWSTAPAALRDYNRTIDNDREYAIGATYRYGLTPRLTIGGGLAVARLGQDFRTVFDYGYFFEDENRRGQNVGGPDDIPYRSDYRTYLLQVAPEVAFTAWRWRRLAVGASVQGRYSWTFYKVVNNGGNALWLRRGYTEYVGEPFAVEVYPGVRRGRPRAPRRPVPRPPPQIPRRQRPQQRPARRPVQPGEVAPRPELPRRAVGAGQASASIGKNG